MLLLLPFAVEFNFEDGFEIVIMGSSEAECVESAVNKYGNQHGVVTWYGGVNNDYYADGELITKDDASEHGGVLAVLIV